MSSTAIVRLGEVLPARPLNSLEEASIILTTLRKEDLAFVLTPLTNVTEIKPFHKISLRAVQLDPSTPGPHCYKASFTKGDEVALGKNGLAAILAAAGANPVTLRIDDRSDPLYAEFQALVYHQDFDGLWRQYPGHKAVDLRDGSPSARAMKPDQLAMARQFVAENAETKAILRALRPLFGLSQTYKAADLKRKAFVVPKLVPHWDLSDPDQKAAAIQQALGNTSRLFGGLPSAEVPQLAEGAAGSPPPPVKEIAKTSDPRALPKPAEEPEAPVIDADLPDFDEPSLVVCGCPCGHQMEVTPEVAELTKQALGGAVRCATCYPGRSFDHNAHKDLRDLAIPRWPKLTADAVRDKWKSVEQKKK